jgi:hypothetical protein
VSPANNVPLGCFKMYVDPLSFVKICNTLVSSSTAEKNEFYLANLKYNTKSSPRLTGMFSCSIALHSESLSLTILVLVADLIASANGVTSQCTASPSSSHAVGFQALA